MPSILRSLLFLVALVVSAHSFAVTKKSSPDPRPTLFTASWCDYCAKAKAYLGKNNIRFREVNIETDDGATDFARHNGKGVPFLLIGDREIYGFSEEKYETAFAKQRK